MKNAPAKILVHSIDQRDHKTLSEALGQEYQFQETRTVGEAMAQCLMVPAPVAVLVGYSDAALDGRNLLVWMKSRPDTSLIPAIAVYESEWQARGGLAFLDGASDYVTRPFNLIAIAVRLRTLIELARFRGCKDLNSGSEPQLYVANQATGNVDVPDLSPAHENYRVMIVDDSEINREIARFFLSEAGFVANSFGETDAALESAASFSYDVVLTDLDMPGRDGYEFSKALRKIPGYGKTPILAMTASTIDEVRQNYLAAGIDGHIDKPVDPEVMVKTVRDLLGSMERSRDATTFNPGGRDCASTGAPDSIREILTSVDGLDYDLGISRLGSKDLYAKLLHEFIALHSQDMAKMSRYLGNSCRADALRLLHTLKGLAATLGLNKIQLASTHLELGMRYEVPAALINLYVDRISELMDRMVLELGFALKKIPSSS